MSEVAMEMGQRLPVKKGYVQWAGKKPRGKTAMMVSIYGERYFFSQRGDGWLAKVDLNDPRISKALADPDSLVKRLATGDTGTSIKQMLVDRDTDQIIKLIFNTTNKDWLLQAYSEFDELEQNQLLDATKERLEQLGVAPDGVTLGKKGGPANEQDTEEAPGTTAEDAGEGPDGEGEDGGNDDPLTLD